MDSRFDPSAFSPAQYGAAPLPNPLPPQAAAPGMRPLSTGEVLDRTFAVYRKNFWLFSGIALVPALVLTLSSTLRLVYASFYPVHQNPSDPLQTSLNSLAYVGKTGGLFLPATLAVLAALAIGHAATTRAVADLYLGLQPTVASCYRAVGRLWLRWTGIYLWQIWSLVWLPLLCSAVIGAAIYAAATGGSALRIAAGILLFVFSLAVLAGTVLGVRTYLRNSLAVPAALLEGLPVRPAMRRSKALTGGRTGRIFLLFLLLWALQIVLGGLQFPLAFAAIRAHGAALMAVQAALLVIQLISASLLGPIGAVGLTLFYIDERVRREGFEFEFQMTGSFLPMGAAAAAPLPAAGPAAEPVSTAVAE